MTVEIGGKTTMSDRELSELVELLRALIRIRSVNPPGDEILAARYLDQVLADEGVPSTVVEPYPGRGSIVARLHGDGSGGDPLLLLSHLDVVPAEPAGWSHDPFGGDLADGYVWGRGALDMKGMVAMEAQVMRRLARTATAAGRDPATDPVPGLRRDVIFCSAADEEAGGWRGANWIVENHPDWLRAAGALNEAGGMATLYRGIRFYPIQVAEKGLAVYRVTVKGHWGHGSVPTAENAAVLAARVITRVSEPGPIRLTEPVRASVARAMPHLAGSAAKIAALVPVAEEGHGAANGAADDPTGTFRAAVDPALVDAAVRELGDPILARTISAMIRDTVSVGTVHAGVKYNVIPGTATIELDCRMLPGTDEPAMRAELRRRIGDELWNRIDVELDVTGPPAQSPLDHQLYRLLERVITDHDPDGVPLPFLAPFATDAKHLARIGVPTYGFSPLKTGSDDGLLALMHADDERVGVEALRWGFPVLYDAVTGFCR
jgi:acetylornithine deacetylase/succinyl-diaminopimelate desuccinylase-like protein